MSNKKEQQVRNIGRRPVKKFVKRANMWCLTSWINGEQHQEWSTEEPKVVDN